MTLAPDTQLDGYYASPAARTMMWRAGDILSSLAGRWRMRRSIEDTRSASSIATLEGRADIIPDGPQGAVYAEEGLLTLAGQAPVNARRTYYYRQQENGLEIFFDEEGRRVFHRLALRRDPDGSLVAADLHLCAADRYEGLYRFRPDGTFSVEHVVTGPHKSYRSTTHYERASPEPAVPPSSGRRDASPS